MANITTTGEAPIFRSVGQALHVAYLMEVLPATQRGIMQAMIEARMKASGVWDEPKSHERTLNFGGLSALEIRGQCAMVRGAVDHHLAQPEIWAVRAQYGHQTTKAGGVRELARYVAPMLACGNGEAVLALAWGIYGNNEQRDGLSVRKVAESYGLSTSSAGRDRQILMRSGTDLLARAVGRLEEIFQSGGLVDC